MMYVSTRGDGEKINSAKAIIKGIAEDKGLYVPEEIPVIKESLSSMAGRTYQEVAEYVIGLFFTDFTKDEIHRCVLNAYDEKFETEEIVPMAKIGRELPAYFLELYHGKTAAFKDMALSILPHLLITAMGKEKEESQIAILTATSGDTGKAALEGFADVVGTQVIVFFPEEGVSAVQKAQMVTQTGDNTHVFAIRGNFDDAQSGVKRIFADNEFAEDLQEKGFKLSSANSINIGRLVPQVAYYVYAYLKLLEVGEVSEGEKINVAVPTGNFGNILAAYYAKQMGIPIGKLICASNENKVLTDFINTGVYDIKRDFHLTNSPSMDILISSNLERLLYHLSDNNSGEIKRLMKKLELDKSYEVSDKIRDKLKEFYADYADQQETLATIRDMYENNGYLIDTHTAVGYRVYMKYAEKTGDHTKTVIASTASPYKFANAVAQAIELDQEIDDFQYIIGLYAETGISVPEGLQNLDKKDVRHRSVINIGQMKENVWNCLK